ncbi:MAG: V-type ATP synthase subunit F [Spirochaetales bacterium]|jgi:V/A-type H+-transporting ATPase subunit F|nr:V-type ATP synthase subunit F [Spirochaetales bacterium]
MKYFVLGDEDAVLGFELAGVSGARAATAEEAEEAFRKALLEGDTGILIITEEVADLIRHVVDRHLFSENFPLIVEIPGSRRTGQPGRDIRALVNEAIGIKL